MTATWAAAEANLAKSLPGYESRVPQRRLAEAIEKTLANTGILMAQAGTGTGKSLAGMIPAIQHALAQGTTVVISTATKALQDQYASKDVVFLLKHLGVDFEAAVLKGRSNYACLQKISELKPGELANLDELRDELAEDGHNGDLDYVRTPVESRFRLKIASTSDECPGKSDCPRGNVCFAEMAKTEAQTAQIVIVNHAMLITDLQLRARNGRGLLPEYGAVIIDEAHELEEYATSSLGSEFTEKGLTTAAAEAANFMGSQKGKNEVAAVNVAAKKLFVAMKEALTDRYGKVAKTCELDEHTLVEYQDVLINTLDAVKGLQTVVEQADVTGDDRRRQRRKRLAKRLDSTARKFEDIILATGAELVRWIENDEKRGVLLKFAPLHVGAFLQRNLWTYLDPNTNQRHSRAGVLLSATLAVGGDFSYVAGRLGVTQYQEFDAGTPFDYPKQARLFVPRGYDPTDKVTWRAQVGATLATLAQASGGRALFLFTSTEAMKDAHRSVAPALEALGIQVFLQGGELSNKAIAEGFKADETSCLFAVKSFMTGIDVQGDALRLVVVDKLPFAVPTDVINKARCEAMDEECIAKYRISSEKAKWHAKGSFFGMTVPAMALTLMQAFGRLIRTMDDEGLVAILDERLLTKPFYGKKIMAALPPATRVNALPDAVAYLERLTARRAA
jgi:ATP-dependent DNA helicase DinG